jgi:hypothetical protein
MLGLSVRRGTLSGHFSPREEGRDSETPAPPEGTGHHLLSSERRAGATLLLGWQRLERKGGPGRPGGEEPERPTRRSRITVEMGQQSAGPATAIEPTGVPNLALKSSGDCALVWRGSSWQRRGAMAGIPPNPACGWTERRAGSREYLDHLADAHPVTLRKIGFADTSTLAGLPRYPLRRIHTACVERETLERGDGR